MVNVSFERNLENISAQGGVNWTAYDLFWWYGKCRRLSWRMVPRHGHFHRCSRYIQSAIKNIDDCLAKQDNKLPAPPRANTPLPSNYSAEIDVSM
jgi:hypothetical protein